MFGLADALFVSMSFLYFCFCEKVFSGVSRLTKSNGKEAI